MAKQAGLGDNFYFGGYDISNDTKELGSISAPSALLERTGIDKSAHERAFGLADGQITFNTYFNDAALKAHAALSPLLKTAQMATYFRGTALGSPAASVIGKQINYDPARSSDGDLVQAVQIVGSDGFPLEWGKQVTAGKANSTGAETLTGVDFGDDIRATSSAFGLAAYLQVFAFTGDDCTITIQESDDNGGSDAFGNITGGAFTQITTAPVTERIETSLTQTIEQFLTLDLTTSAGYSSIDFAVMIIRYYTANRNEGAYS